MLFRHNILNGIWAITKDYAANYLPLIDTYIKGESMRMPNGETDVIQFATKSVNNNIGYQISEFGNDASPESAPQDSVAIIRITGAITKYDQNCGPAGIQTKAELLKRCYNNPNVKAIALIIDSGGGQSYAMFQMAEAIAQRNKPVGAFIDDSAFSAAAGIATACDYVVANSKMAKVGSFGTYGTIVDYSERYKMQGINIKELYATQSTDKNQPFIQALEGKTELLQKEVDAFNEHFLSLVEENRKGKLTADRSKWGTGKEFFAEEAIELGIIDGIDTLENFINYFNV